jgi:hypothetical protein
LKKLDHNNGRNFDSTTMAGELLEIKKSVNVILVEPLICKVKC